MLRTPDARPTEAWAAPAFQSRSEMFFTYRQIFGHRETGAQASVDCVISSAAADLGYSSLEIRTLYGRKRHKFTPARGSVLRSRF